MVSSDCFVNFKLYLDRKLLTSRVLNLQWIKFTMLKQEINLFQVMITVAIPAVQALKKIKHTTGCYTQCLSCRHGIILLAIVDHRYLFRYINIGSPGRCPDTFVYGRSKLCKRMESNSFQSPVSVIEGTKVPPVVLCDQAFPLSANLLKPFANASGPHQAAFN